MNVINKARIEPKAIQTEEVFERFGVTLIFESNSRDYEIKEENVKDCFPQGILYNNSCDLYKFLIVYLTFA